MRDVNQYSLFYSIKETNVATTNLCLFSLLFKSILILADAAVTLNGKSYIIYKLKKSFDELFTKFQISFRTESLARSTIFDASGKDFFRLEVRYFVPTRAIP